MIHIFLTFTLGISFTCALAEDPERIRHPSWVFKRSPQKPNSFYKELNRQVKFQRHKSAAKKSVSPLAPKIDDRLFGNRELKKQLNQLTKTNGPSSYALLNSGIYEGVY